VGGGLAHADIRVSVSDGVTKVLRGGEGIESQNRAYIAIRMVLSTIISQIETDYSKIFIPNSTPSR